MRLNDKLQHRAVGNRSSPDPAYSPVEISSRGVTTADLFLFHGQPSGIVGALQIP